jgi:alpha-L-glutamate ligase-like protein
MFRDVLGINARNINYIFSLNPRHHYTLVDEKLVTKQILEKNGFPTPKLLGVAATSLEIPSFIDHLKHCDSFVLKPSRGSGGKGICVVRAIEGTDWIIQNGERYSPMHQYEHVNNIVYGVYSLDNTTDRAFAERRILPHPSLEPLAANGIPDCRIIVYKGRPLCSMLRVPTVQSNGKANLHAGGFAVRVDLESGKTGRGWYRRKYITRHPDTGTDIAGIDLPQWKRVLDIASSLRDCFPLDFLGVDFAFDRVEGAVVLELNARPGLEIQNVVGIGMKKCIEKGEG